MKLGKRLFLLAWLLSPILIFSYYFNAKPLFEGQLGAKQQLADATALEEEGKFREFMDAYDATLNALPEKSSMEVIYSLKLIKAQAQLRSKLLAEAIKSLNTLLIETTLELGPNAAVTREVRETLGHAHYQAAIVLRKDPSAKKPLWKKHIDRARQQFRYLVENSGRDEKGGKAIDSASFGDTEENAHSLGKNGLNVYSIDDKEIYNLHALLWLDKADNDDVPPPSAAPMPRPIAVKNVITNIRKKLKNQKRSGS